MRTLLARLRGQAIAITALCVALGGTSYAAVSLPKNSVSATQIKSGAVGGSEVKNGSLTGADVKNRSLTAADFAGSVAGPTGPAGASGAPGPQGAKGNDGAAGTARAHVWVEPNHCSATVCQRSHAKGVTAVRLIGSGRYCVDTPGLDPDTTPAVVSAEYGSTSAPETTAQAMWVAESSGCGANSYGVRTQRIGTTLVRNASNTGSETVLSPSTELADDVAFVIAIP